MANAPPVCSLTIEELSDFRKEALRLLDPREVAAVLKHGKSGAGDRPVQVFRDGDRTNPTVPSNENECLSVDFGEIGNLACGGETIYCSLRVVRPCRNRPTHIADEGFRVCCGIMQ